MEAYEKEGIFEEVRQNEETSVGETYYMPHHAVVRADKSTTKTRIVYDAFSKCGGASLNECLYSGEINFTDLLATLLRFRCYRIGLIADIQQAFLSGGVKEEDRNALRFLWVKTPERTNAWIRLMRFTRVCFGIISSMAHLDFTIRHHLNLYGEKYANTVEKIRNSLYVDDLTAGDNSQEEAWKLYKETKHIFRVASMNIRKWKTNDNILSEKIYKCETAETGESEEAISEGYAAEYLNPDELAATKVLGIPWEIKGDCIIFTLESLKKYTPGRITKRVMLKTIASVFDPLGFLAPVVINLKILFQEVCKLSKDWDEILDRVHQEKWDEFRNEVKDFKGFQVPRFFGEVILSTSILVGFCDASENAYAACIYIVNKDKRGVATSLVVSKTRVAPLKTQSIPRLELLATLILSRLMQRTKDELGKVRKLERIICCTDAEIVLHWIQWKEKIFRQFVQNRVAEIRRNIQIDTWYHGAGDVHLEDLMI